MKNLVMMLVGTLIGGSVVVVGLSAVVVVAGVGGGIAVMVMMEPDLEAPARSTAPRAKGPTEIVIDSGAAAIDLRLDGTSMQYDRNSGWVGRVGPGRHVVRAHNVFGKEVAAITVDAKRGTRTMLKYSKKKFTRKGTVATRAPRPVAQPRPVIVQQPRPVFVQQPQPVFVQQAPAPSFGLGSFGLTGGSQTTESHKTTSNSQRYGEVRTSAPGRQETHGYNDQRGTEDSWSRKTGFGW